MVVVVVSVSSSSFSVCSPVCVCAHALVFVLALETAGSILNFAGVEAANTISHG